MPDRVNLSARKRTPAPLPWLGIRRRMAAETKQAVLDEIAHLLRTPRRPLGPGSKEKKQFLRDIVRALSLGLDSAPSKPTLAGQIARALGMGWDNKCWSAGDTLTLVGLQRLRDGVRRFRVRRRAPRGPARDETELGVVDRIRLTRFRELPDPDLRPDAYRVRGDPALQRALQEKALKGHRQTLNALARVLREAGARCREDRASIDLIAEWPDRATLLVEVKTAERSLVGRARMALAQLLEYAYRSKRQLRARPMLGIVFDRRPAGPKWLIPYLTRDRRLNVIWRENDSFWISGPDAKAIARRVPAIGVSA
jgi:Holliday junction resolvase